MKKALAASLILIGALLAQPAQAAGELPLVLELLQRSAGVRFALRSTDEGAALAERLIGHRIQGEADFDRIARELERPEREGLVEGLARKLPRLDAAEGEEWLRAMARETLVFDPASDAGFAAARDRFVQLPASRYKVAAVQYPVQGGRTLDELLSKMTAYATRAKNQGAQLIVFPELFVLDRIDPASPLAEADQLAAIARNETGVVFARAKQLSRELGIAILAGSFPREAEGGIVNTALLAFPDGRVILQDKLNLTPDEVTWGWKAGQELKVFDAPWGRSTILICYDSQFPSVSSQLGEAAPEVILIPSMTGAKGFHRVRWAAQARAVEHHAYVVVTGTVDAPGVAPQFMAQAAFLTPQDEGFPGVLRQGPKGRGAVVFGELDLEKLRQSRRSAGVYSTRDEGRREAPVRVVKLP